MCGIFGIMWHRLDKIPEEHRLKETARLMRHRGPDTHAIYGEAGLGLVHTRLSLLDLTSRSNQPFWDKQGRYCLVYNGEIYNFKELRAELEQRRIQFRTTSDTEVLLECLINYGAEVTLSRLEGMFSFALYDKVERTLLLARDRFGIKPLFIYDVDDAFVFASEIMAMRPWVKFEPDNLSISSFLYGFGGPTKRYSFFRNIKFVPPGTLVNVRKGQSPQYKAYSSIVDFWDRDRAEQSKGFKPGELVDNLEQLLYESVKKQLFADAPVGALCSGGLDSSLIMAMAARFHSNLAIFHSNVIGPLSEHEAAMLLAKHLKLDMKTIEVRDEDFLGQFADVTARYGQPFYHTPHSVPFFMVSKLVRRNGVKAVLSGEGSDECFLGYSWLAPDIRQWKQHTMKLFKKLRRIIGGRGRRTGLSSVSMSELVMELHNRFEVAVEREENRIRIRDAGRTAEREMYTQSLDLLNYNLRALLHRNDAMGMAASIESRFPFLDSQVVNLAVNMSHKWKIRFSPTTLDSKHPFFKDKWILRKVAERYLPSKLSQRTKQPFPVDAFQRMQISPAFFDKSFIVDLFGLSIRELQYLIDNANHTLKLKLMHLDVWGDVYLNNRSRQSIISRLKEHIRVRPAV